MRTSGISYNIGPDTSGLVAVIKGRWFICYPRSRFTADSPTWGCRRPGEIRLGLFGVDWGRIKPSDPKVTEGYAAARRLINQGRCPRDLMGHNLETVSPGFARGWRKACRQEGRR